MLKEFGVPLGMGVAEAALREAEDGGAETAVAVVGVVEGGLLEAAVAEAAAEDEAPAEGWEALTPLSTSVNLTLGMLEATDRPS